DRVAVAADKYFAARKKYLDAVESEIEAEARSLAPVSAGGNGLAGISTDPFLRLQLASVDKNLTLLPNDSDPGFQELRKAWERERLALVALSSLGKNAQTAQTQVRSDLTRPVREHYGELAGQLKQESRETERIAIAWATYYRTLAEGARGTV